MKKSFVVLLAAPVLAFGDIAVTLPASGSSSTLLLGSAYGTWGTLGGGFQISWNITQSGSNFNYIYTISNALGGSLSSGISSFVLELNPAITSSNLSSVIFNSNTAISGTATTYASGSSVTKYAPGSIYGIAFTPGGTGTATVSFTSTNAPVWGSFYAGNGLTNILTRGYAYNSSYTSNPSVSATDFSAWVPTVGATSVVAPEPSTYLILGSMLAAIGYAQRKRRFCKTQ